MTKAQLLASRALWGRRERFRHAKWTAYRGRHPQTARITRLRKKWWALWEEADKQLQHREAQLAALPKPPPSKRAEAVAWAGSKVGVHEVPPGSNRGPQIDLWQRRFGMLAEPWCGLFAGNALVHADVKGVTSRIASVGAIQEDAEAKRGCFSGWTAGSAHSALRGDLVVLFGFGIHVELIREVHADGSVTTIGGNTSPSPGSGSEFAGGCVAERHRDASVIHGVAHVRYGTR